MRFIGNAPVDGEVRAIASGALATGDTVIVNADGTVSVVAETTESATESLGSATVFEVDTSNFVASAYDPVNDKYVICYVDVPAGSHGTAIVATVSGTTVSFGSPTAFHAANTADLDVVYDSDAARMVIAFRDEADSDKTKVISGTISGTSISFGAEREATSAYAESARLVYDTAANKTVLFLRNAASGGYGTSVVLSYNASNYYDAGTAVIFASANTMAIDACFDSDRNQVIAAYTDYSNSQRGTTIVGTVSGTSISFGTETVFENDGTSTFDGSIGVAYNSTFSRVILTYAPLNTNYGEIALGTNSGTSISVFSRQIFNAATTTTFCQLVSDPQANGAVVVYRDNGNSSKGTYRVCTFNGTGSSFTFGSETVFEAASTNYRYGPSINPSNSKILIAYQDVGNSSAGTAIVLQNAYSADVTNLTSENFVGFANSGYASGQSAAINSTCSVDKNQSGLTAGETYYVQADGTLGTAPDDPSVVAGTAISSNSIIVKG